MDDNTSGQGKAAVAIPAGIDRWNWGAFLLHWIWGIGNSVFIALLMFVPVVNIVMPFVLGAKGSIWAWRNRRWDSVEHFQRVQRKWAIWAVVSYLVVFALVAAAVFSVPYILQQSEPYQVAVARVQGNAEAVSALGEPISIGLPWGNIQVSGPDGKADFSFSVTGPKGKGTVYIDARKDLGTWRVERLELDVPGRSGRINLK
jgi:hypothetical protein